jgi:hypothetical protein
MVSKADFKNLFQSSSKHMLTKRKNRHRRKTTWKSMMSLDMNVFENLMEGKHTTFLSNGDDDLKIINDTNTFSYSEKNSTTDKLCLGIKLKHEPEDAHEIDQYNILQTLL